MEKLSLDQAVFIRLVLQKYVMAQNKIWLETSDEKTYLGSITKNETQKFLVRNKPADIPVKFVFETKVNGRKKEIIIDPFKIVKVRFENQPEQDALHFRPSEKMI